MYHLEAEIKEQPLTVKRSFDRIINHGERIKDLFYDDRDIFIIGSGSSYHSALFLSFILDRLSIFNRPMQSSLFRDMLESSKYKDGLVIAFSQSGESSDVIASAKAAKNRNFKLVSITNGETNTLAHMSDHNLSYNVGEEIAITATKSFTGSLIASSAIYSLISGLDINIAGLSASIDELIAKSASISMDFSFKKAIFLGSGIFNVSAMEGALKLRETAGIDAEGFPFREYQHGYIETLDDQTLVVCISDVPSDKIRTYTSKFLLVDTVGSDLISGLDDPLLRAIADIIPLQILALRSAIARNIDPDHPKKLTKVVK
ncbi:MAG: SIS domain-containing protein [Thermoplasmata archaeon]